ncbi:hypothetical protein HDU83_006792 [Entophlyctis luteolus]|nr:hypothetical protein HDU83_006792 [Entophlyctis luteolus]
MEENLKSVNTHILSQMAVAKSVETIDAQEDIELQAADAEAHGKVESTAFGNVKVPLGRAQFALVYLGLMLAVLLASLDQTIVATALKAIVIDLGHQELISWIGSAYLLTAAPLGTLYGKFADIFGRKAMFLFALVTFELGSLICGLAPTMEVLIVGRAVAGVGGGGIFSLVLIILSDIVSLEDRGRFQGPIGAVFGLSAVIAPLLGGVFSDHVSWRWCFYINLPLGAITVLTVIAFLNFPPVEGSIREKIARIDGLGAVLLFIAVFSFMVPLQLGGSVWDWNSPQVIVLFVLSGVFAAIFVYVELRYAKEPIVPRTVFVNRSVPSLIGIALSLGAMFLSIGYYISLFFQVVFGDSATIAGVETIPLVFGLVFTSIASGILVSRLGKYRHFFFIGPIVMIIGAVLISYFDASSSLVKRVFFLFIFGLGLGSLIQMRVIAIQASVPPSLVAIATALVQTGNTLGGAVGVAITGTVINNLVASNTADSASLSYFITAFNERGIAVKSSDVLTLLGLLEEASAYYPEGNATQAALYNATLASAVDALKVGFNDAFKVAVLSALPYAGVILLLAFFVQQFQMKSGGPGSSNAVE